MLKLFRRNDLRGNSTGGCLCVLCDYRLRPMTELAEDKCSPILMAIAAQSDFSAPAEEAVVILKTSQA